MTWYSSLDRTFLFRHDSANHTLGDSVMLNMARIGCNGVYCPQMSSMSAIRANTDLRAVLGSFLCRSRVLLLWNRNTQTSCLFTNASRHASLTPEHVNVRTPFASRMSSDCPLMLTPQLSVSNLCELTYDTSAWLRNMTVVRMSSRLTPRSIGPNGTGKPMLWRSC